MREYYSVEEIKEILGVSTSMAYKVIKKMNDDLTKKGYLTISGKVPRRYFEKQWYGLEERGNA